MANENKNVIRIEAVDRTSLESDLDEKMLGFESDNDSIGFKKASGEMVYFESGVQSQDTSETPTTDPTTESYSGDLTNQKDVNDAKQNVVNGFENQDDVNIVQDLNGALPRITVSSVSGAELFYWVDGKRLSIPASGSLTATFTDVEGEHWVSINSAGVLVNNEDHVISNNCAVHLYYWNADDKRFEYGLPQPHGMTWAISLHLNNHLTRGSKVQNGNDQLRITNFTPNGDGTTDAQFQYSRLSGDYFDEDIRYSLSAGNTWSPVYHLNSAGNIRYNIQSSATGGVDSHLHNAPSGRVYYNPVTGAVGEGVGSLVEADSGSYVLHHMFAPAGATVQDVTIMGENQYNTLDEARKGCIVEYKNTVLAYGILREMPYLGTVIIQTSDDFTNTYKARVVEFSTSVEGIEQEYYDGRYPANNILTFEDKSGSTTQYIGAWDYEIGTAGSGEWVVNAAGIGTATTLTMHRREENGNNQAPALESLTVGSKIVFDNELGSTASFTLDSAWTLANQRYTWDVIDVVETGTGIVDGDLCAFYKEVTTAAQTLQDVTEEGATTTIVSTFENGAKTGETGLENASAAGDNFASYNGIWDIADITLTAGTSVTIDEQTSYANGAMIVIAANITVSSTIAKNVSFLSFSTDYAPYKNARGVLITTEPTGDNFSGFINSSTCDVYSYKAMPSDTYRVYVCYPRQ